MKAKKLLNWKVIISIILIFIVINVLFISGAKKSANKYNTTPVTMGNIKKEVTASGEINPVNLVQVGSQVSGIVEELLVDRNDVVKKGQVVARIDDSVLQSSLNDALAKLKSAKANRDYMKTEFERSQELFEKGYIAKSELDLAQNNYITAEENHNSAQTVYDRAKVNLGYATIRSPVSGTIIAKSVEKGQTVAASFQTPEIFQIAEDLKKMQIETSVSEADIGLIKNGQNVTFTVDAFPTSVFNGKVKQIRLSPTTEQNVVVYTVVIDVDNSDLRLYPGMTAFVTILIEEKDNVLKAKNIAFNLKNLKELTQDEKVQSGELTGKNAFLILRDNNKKPIIAKYKKGIYTALESEIISDEVQEGDKIITGLTNATTEKKSSNRGGPMGGPR